MKRSLGKIASHLLVGAAAVFSGASFAASMPITWDFGGSTLMNQSSINVTVGGHTVKARAYASGANDGSGAFTAAKISRYSGGLGVSNCVSGQETCSGDPGSPNHATDTSGRNDFILLEFDSFYSMQSFAIGWPSASEGLDTDMQLWIGPDLGHAGVADAANLNLAGACVSGCSSTLTSLGFSTLPAYSNVAVGVNKTIPSTNPSRYLLVSGALGSGDNDFFKFKSVTASLPEPSTMLLFGLGAAGLLARRRRVVQG
jgi:hypothetical protein